MSPESVNGNAATELLGLVAVTQIGAFERAAAAASLTQEFADKVLLAGFAVRSYEQFTQVQDRLAALGGDPDAAMRPFVAAVEMFHQRTVPADALEGLVKAYITMGIIADFFRELAAGLDDSDDRSAVDAVLADIGHADTTQGAAMADRVRAAVAADPRLGPRLALWARRVLGEALAKAVTVVSTRKSLADLLPADEADRHRVERVFERLSERHNARMAELGMHGN